MPGKDLENGVDFQMNALLEDNLRGVVQTARRRRTAPFLPAGADFISIQILAGGPRPMEGGEYRRSGTQFRMLAAPVRPLFGTLDPPL